MHHYGSYSIVVLLYLATLLFINFSNLLFLYSIVKSVISFPLHHTTWGAVELSTACSGVFMYHGVSQA